MWTFFSAPWKLMVWKMRKLKAYLFLTTFCRIIFWTHTGKAERNTSRAAQAIDKDEEDALFEVGEFGDSDPNAFQRAVWWFLSLHFGFRGKGNISQAIPYSLPPFQFIVVQTKDRSAGAHKNERKRRIVIESDEDDWLWQAIFCQLCPIWISQLQTFTWLWLIMFCKACKKILFDRQKTLSRILESTIVSVRFRYKRLHIQ